MVLMSTRRRSAVAGWYRVAELTKAASLNVPAAVGRTATVIVRRVRAGIVRRAHAKATSEVLPESLRHPLHFRASTARARRVEVPTRPTMPLRRTPLAALGPRF